MSKEHYKEQAARLASHLANKHGVKLRPAATLEAVAAMYGARDWNTLAAGALRAQPTAAAAADEADVSAGEALFQQILAAGAEEFNLWVVGYEYPIAREPGTTPGKRVRIRELTYSTPGLTINARPRRELGSDLCEFLERKAEVPPINFEAGAGTLGQFEYEFAGKVHQVLYRATGRRNFASISVEFSPRERQRPVLVSTRLNPAQAQPEGELHLMPTGIRQEYCYTVARDLGVTNLKWAGAKWTQVNPADFGEAELWFVRVDTQEEALACEALVLAGHRVLARVAGETVADAVEQLKQWGLSDERLQKLLHGLWGLPRLAF